VSKTIFTCFLALALLSYAVSAGSGENETETQHLIHAVRQGPQVHTEVYDPETNTTKIWDAKNGTSEVAGNKLKQKASSSSSSEEKKKEES
jgi:hypothetical protein